MAKKNTGRPAGPAGAKERAFDPKQIARGSRAIDIVPQSYDPNEHTVELVLSEGARVERWYGIEALSTDESAVNVDRLRTSGISFLDSHDQYGIDKVIGRIVAVWFEAGRVLGRAKFGETERARQAEGMVARGEIKGVSIGYSVDAWTIADADGIEIDPETQNIWAFEGLTFTASRWELLEVSLVSVPADPAAMVRSHPGSTNGDLRATPMGRAASEITVASGDHSITYRYGAVSPRERALPDEAKGHPMSKPTTSRLERAKVAVSRISRPGRGAASARVTDGAHAEAKPAVAAVTDIGSAARSALAKRAAPTVDDDGYYVDENGDYCDADGAEVDEPVKAAQRAAPTVDDDGYYVDADGDYCDADGAEVDEPVKADRDGQTDDEPEGDDDTRGAPPAVARSGLSGRRQLTQAQAAELSRIGEQARAEGIVLNVTDAIERGLSPAALRKIAFDKLADKSREGQVRSATTNQSRVKVLRDEAEGRRDAMELALVTRTLASRGGDAVDYKPKRKEAQRWVERHAQRAEEFLGMGFVEIAAECLGHRGNIRTSRQAIDMIERAFQTTSDFPAIFANVLNKVLLARYELAEPTYKLLSIERPFKDFRPHPMVRAGEFPMLQPVTQSGELVAGKSADTGESITLVPYGVTFPITRQMIVNDELGAIDQILGSSGDSVRLFENATFFKMFNSNPVLMQDGNAVFSVAHNNLAGTATAIDVIAVGNGRAALRAMRSISGFLLNVPPRMLVTGPLLETQADQMVADITPQLTTSVNPFSGKLKSVSDANITDASWYLIADPNQLPCYVHGFLDGADGPRVRTYEPFGTQGVKISIEHDFAVGAIDYRGAYRNPGQAPAAS